MATNKRFIVVAETGGDYSNLQTALTTEATNLVQQDVDLEIHVSGSWTAAHPPGQIVPTLGYITDETHWVNIRFEKDVAGPLNGAYNPNGWRIDRNGIRAFYVYTPSYLLVDGLQVYNTTASLGGSLSVVNFSGSFTLRNSLLWNNASPRGGSSGFSLSATGSKTTEIKIYNNVFSGFYNGIYVSYPGGAVSGSIQNNTIIDCTNYGFVWDGSGTTGGNNENFRNNLVIDNSSKDFFNTSYDVGGNNISSDATSPDVSFRSKTITLMDPDNGDFNLAFGDADAIGTGDDLTTEASLIELETTTDMAGTTREAPWDIGALKAGTGTSINSDAVILVAGVNSDAVIQPYMALGHWIETDGSTPNTWRIGKNYPSAVYEGLLVPDNDIIVTSFSILAAGNHSTPRTAHFDFGVYSGSLGPSSPPLGGAQSGSLPSTLLAQTDNTQLFKPLPQNSNLDYTAGQWYQEVDGKGFKWQTTSGSIGYHTLPANSRFWIGYNHDYTSLYVRAYQSTPSPPAIWNQYMPSLVGTDTDLPSTFATELYDNNKIYYSYVTYAFISEITSDAHIINISTINSDAVIAVNETDTITSDAFIIHVDTKTITSDAVILKVDTETITSDALIAFTDTSTINSDGHIYATETSTINSDATLAATETITITSDAQLIFKTTITSDAFVDNIYTFVVAGSILHGTENKSGTFLHGTEKKTTAVKHG